VLSYERHAAGRQDLPSAATLRNRLGRWSAITAQLAAERELALHAPVPAPAIPEIHPGPLTPSPVTGP
jgi:hypothetical protein